MAKLLNNSMVDKLGAQDKDYIISDSKQTGLRLKVTPAGGKIYYLYYKVAGKLKKYRMGRCEDVGGVPEARKKAEKLRGQVLNGIDIGSLRMEAKSALKDAYTLGDYLKNVYLTEIRERLSSHKRIKYIIKHNFKDWYAVDIGRIDKHMMDKYINSELKRGIADRTINRSILAIKGVINHAVDKEVIESSGIAKVKQRKVDRKGVLRYLSADEESRLLKALDGYGGAGKYIKPLVILLLNTGLRPNEAKQLKWSDIQNGQIRVVGDNSKNGQTRYVPFEDVLKIELDRWAEESGSDGYIFKSSKGGHIQSTETIWRQVRDDAKLESFRMYDLRHSYASTLVMLGADLYAVSQLLGHSSIEMTQIYAHLSPDHLRSTVSLLSNRKP